MLWYLSSHFGDAFIKIIYTQFLDEGIKLVFQQLDYHSARGEICAPSWCIDQLIPLFLLLDTRSQIEHKL